MSNALWSKLNRTHFIYLFLYRIYIRLHLHWPLFPQVWRKHSCASKWSGQRDIITSCVQGALVFQHYWKRANDYTRQQDFWLYQKYTVTTIFSNENSMKIWINMVYLWILGNLWQTWQIEIFWSGPEHANFTLF